MVRWLRCAIKKGMFKDERVIKIRAGMTFFVHQDLVQGGIDKMGLVRVELLETKDQYWVMLPTEDTAIVEVDADELETVGG
jgi:hypothetical protein